MCSSDIHMQASTLLQGLLTKLVVRMACWNQDHAATVLRPILTSVKEFTASSMATAENDLFRVTFSSSMRSLVLY